MIDIDIRTAVSLPFGATLRVIPGRDWQGGKPPSTPRGNARADYLTRKRFPAQDQEQEKNPEEVKVLRGNSDQVAAVALRAPARARFLWFFV